MKRRFLLDENVLYHAVKGVDEHDNPDLTATQLVVLIATNCHSVTINRFLRDRYLGHLKVLESAKGVLQPLFFLTQFINNSAKAVWEDDDPPQLPRGANIPAEDVDVVRAALISRPIFVTAERGLRNAINVCAALHLRAMSPAEAIPYAQES